jgi:hypothetical protein
MVLGSNEEQQNECLRSLPNCTNVKIVGSQSAAVCSQAAEYAIVVVIEDYGQLSLPDIQHPLCRFS